MDGFSREQERRLKIARRECCALKVLKQPKNEYFCLTLPNLCLTFSSRLGSSQAAPALSIGCICLTCLTFLHTHMTRAQALGLNYISAHTRVFFVRLGK